MVYDSVLSVKTHLYSFIIIFIFFVLFSAIVQDTG